MLSSLVGEMMMIPVPFLGMNFSLYTNSTAGTRNASVFPEPVFADPTRSLPSRRWGMVWA